MALRQVVSKRDLIVAFMGGVYQIKYIRSLIYAFFSVIGTLLTVTYHVCICRASPQLHCGGKRDSMGLDNLFVTEASMKRKWTLKVVRVTLFPTVMIYNNMTSTSYQNIAFSNPIQWCYNNRKNYGSRCVCSLPTRNLALGHIALIS